MPMHLYRAGKDAGGQFTMNELAHDEQGYEGFPALLPSSRTHSFLVFSGLRAFPVVSVVRLKQPCKMKKGPEGPSHQPVPIGSHPAVRFTTGAPVMVKVPEVEPALRG